MSIRVNSQEVGLTPQSGALDAVKSSGTSASGFFAGKSVEDKIDVSSTAENIRAALESHEAQQSRRVAHLANLVAEGRYEVSTTALSSAIVSKAASH
jgi:hypothetical protein